MSSIKISCDSSHIYQFKENSTKIEQNFNIVYDSKNTKPNYSKLTVTSCPKIDKKTCQGNRKFPKHENVCEIIFTSVIFLFFSLFFYSIMKLKVKFYKLKNTHFFCERLHLESEEQIDV